MDSAPEPRRGRVLIHLDEASRRPTDSRLIPLQTQPDNPSRPIRGNPVDQIERPIHRFIPDQSRKDPAIRITIAMSAVQAGSQCCNYLDRRHVRPICWPDIQLGIGNAVSGQLDSSVIAQLLSDLLTIEEAAKPREQVQKVGQRVKLIKPISRTRKRHTSFASQLFNAGGTQERLNMYVELNFWKSLDQSFLHGKTP